MLEGKIQQFMLEGKIQQSSIFKSKNKHFGYFKANLTLKVKVTNFQTRLRHLDDPKKTVEAKIPKYSNVVAFRRNDTIILYRRNDTISFQVNLTLRSRSRLPVSKPI